MTAPLFDMPTEDADRKHQACDRCLLGAWASDDVLRARGWIVFDGKSVTGRDLHVRICPDCRRKETK